MKRSTTTIQLATLFAFVAGCSTPNPPDASTDSGSDASTDAANDSAALADAASDAATSMGDAVIIGPATDAGSDLHVFTALSASMGQLAEGIAARDNALYVGLAPTGQILRIDATGTPTAFAQVPIPPSMSATPMGYLLGLAFDRAGNLYAAAPSFSDGFQAGIYRIPPTGGAATMFARDTMGRMNFPNAIDFDADENLFVTDSSRGAVFKISRDGATITQWAQSPLLTGVMGANPCGAGAGFPIGANGIAFDVDRANAYVTNTDRATVVRIPINADGTAGAPVVFVAQNCTALAGADGLTRGPDGALYAAANVANTLVRVAPDGALSMLEQGGQLDSPASVLFASVGGSRQLFVTNAAFTSAQTPGGTPRPGVLVRSVD